MEGITRAGERQEEVKVRRKENQEEVIKRTSRRGKKRGTCGRSRLCDSYEVPIIDC